LRVVERPGRAQDEGHAANDRGDERCPACRSQVAKEKEKMVPHPFHVILNLEERHAEFHAESAREQRARLAEQAGAVSARRRWLDLLAALVALVALVLIVVAGAATPAESPLAGPLAAILLP
jgi:hypothetical protein